MFIPVSTGAKTKEIDEETNELVESEINWHLLWATVYAHTGRRLTNSVVIIVGY